MGKVVIGDRVSQSTPKKTNDHHLAGYPCKKLNFNEICEVSSSIIKEEIVELLDDMKDFESIEMTHNLSDLFFDSPMSSNSFNCQSPIFQDIKLEQHSEYEDVNTRDSQLKDPLQIDIKMKKEGCSQSTLIIKENKLMIAKPILKNKRKRNLPDPHDLSNYSKRLEMTNESKSENKFLKLQEDETKKGYLDTKSSSDRFFKMLKDFKVQLQHEVPPQHMIECGAGARNLNPKQVAEFEQYGLLKKGSFSMEEDEIIKHNWETFCHIHKWNKHNVEPFLYKRYKGKYYIPLIEQRKRFVQFLANGLPWRSLFSVHYRFRNIYNTSVNNGPYTAEEDKQILSFMNKASNIGVDNKCAELAKLLNRKRQSIWTRYQKLKKYNKISTSPKRKEIEAVNRKKRIPDKISVQKLTPKQIFSDVKWTSPLVKKFIDSIIEVTDCSNLEDLKNQNLHKTVWRQMQNKMSIDKTILKNFWYLQLHMQLFCPTPVYLNDTKVKLIEHMYTNKLEDPETIDWDLISVDFNGITPLFLSQLFEKLLIRATKDAEVSNLNDVLEYLHENYLPVLMEKPVDAVLPKLFYHNGQVICIDKGSEKKIPNKYTTNPLCDEEEF